MWEGRTSVNSEHYHICPHQTRNTRHSRQPQHHCRGDSLAALPFVARDDIDHPLLPNVVIFAGPDATISYDTPEDLRHQLGNYATGQIDGMTGEIVAAYR